LDESFAMSSFFMESPFIWSLFIESVFVVSCFMVSLDCAKATAQNNIAADISFTNMCFINTSLLLGLVRRLGAAISRGRAWDAGGEKKLQVTEKSRHQIFAEGGNQRRTRKT
jgi:hypothetical protein